MKPAFFLFVFLLALIPEGNSQSLRLSIPARLETGVNFARMERDSGRTWIQFPGSAISLASGLGIRYKQRFSLLAEAGILFDTYTFRSSGVEYSITNMLWELRLNAHYIIPLKNYQDRYLYVGADAGRTFYENDRLREDLGNAVAESRAFGPASWLLSPEMGFATRLPHGEFSIALTYVYHLRDEPTVEIDLLSPGGATRANAKGDYLGFRTRFLFDITGRKPYKLPVVPNPPESPEFALRDTRKAADFEMRSGRLVMRLRDNGDIDGDTVSVSVDGQYLLSQYALTRKPKKLVIRLAPGSHEIRIMAHNEGRVPPNTAEISMKSGRNRMTLLSSTGLDRNESISVFRKSED